MKTWRQLTLSEKSILAWGKLRRLYLSHFRPGYVARSLRRRRGDCHRTGVCCNLLYTCPILEATPLPACRINSHKPKVCKSFPIDERDLRDRDILAPETPCGFSFAPPDRNGDRLLRNP